MSPLTIIVTVLPDGFLAPSIKVEPSDRNLTLFDAGTRAWLLRLHLWHLSFLRFTGLHLGPMLLPYLGVSVMPLAADSTVEYTSSALNV